MERKYLGKNTKLSIIMMHLIILTNILDYHGTRHIGIILMKLFFLDVNVNSLLNK